MLELKTVRQKFAFALLLTLLTAFTTWYYEQYIALIVGVVTAGLRILLFWISDEGKPFVDHAISAPVKRRAPEVQQELEQVYEHYEEINVKRNPFKGLKGYLVSFMVFAVIIYFDKRMIFYTFFMGLSVTWLWFQWYLGVRVRPFHRSKK